MKQWWLTGLQRRIMFTIAAFVEALTLEEVGTDRYRAGSLSSAHGVVFGGSCWRSP